MVTLDIKIFDEAINEILNDIDQYITLPEKDKWDEKTIEDANIEYTIERGSKRGLCTYIYYLSSSIKQEYN